MLYSHNGLRWADMDTILLRPAVGIQKVLRDPSMVQGPDGTFHLVWTSSWRGDKGFGYAASKDLVHWSQQKLIPVMEHEPTTVNVWAPELFYDEDGKQFIIIWASCIPGRFERGIEADSNNHRMYYTTTTDFVHFTKASIFYDPGFSVIDGVIVKRAAKDYVLVVKDNTRPARNLHVAFSNSPFGPWSQQSQPFTAQLTEGPAVLRKNSREWLIYYDDYGKKRYDAKQTLSFRSFKDAARKISIPKGHKHGTIVPLTKHRLAQVLKAYSQKDTLK